MMSRRLDEDDDEIPSARRGAAEREVTLGTGAILGIFFGLVVLVGASIGFGYKLGSATRSAAAAVPGDAPAPITTAPPTTNFNAFKPAAGSPAASSGSPAPGITVHDSAPVLTAPPGGGPAHVTPSASSTTAAQSEAPRTGSPATSQTGAPAGPLASASLPMPAASAGGAFVVQIAAVSHQEDADLLVNSLHAKGYAVSARSESGDRLIHIQVGPFSTRKDAETMKVRLGTDGYNAFIK